MKPILLLLLLGLSATHAQTGKRPAAFPPKGFTAIFNGKDLTGWYGLNPHSVAKLTGEKKEAALKQMRDDFSKHWRVEKGELVNDGTGPYATTEADFGDYELMLEYKTVPKADSGVYLRGNPQVQIWDDSQIFDPAKPDRRPHLGSGGLFNNTPKTLGRDPIGNMDRDFGQLNTMKIKQIGARTWVTLNGRTVVEGAAMENFWDKTQPFPAKGPFMLQTHGGEIRWRHIAVRPISEAEREKTLATTPELPNPTQYDVSYGPHPKQLIHFWQAKSAKPTPLLMFIHGGGWRGGARLSGLMDMLNPLLQKGISVASVEYRFIPEATADKLVPPVKGPMGDAARALQFIRSKATEWNIDKARIAASGGSAGACSSLWLAFHPDMAEPNSADPVSRESTRLLCAAVTGAQTSLDPHQMREWTPNSSYGAHAFGLGSFEEFHAQRDSIKPWIAEYSPYALVSADDPPVYLSYSSAPHIGQAEKDPTHSANFGLKLQEHCKASGMNCDLAYPGASGVKDATVQDYLIRMLKQ
jgi:acetyl esterase/lipase